jgi:hypothetical protein
MRGRPVSGSVAARLEGLPFRAVYRCSPCRRKAASPQKNPVLLEPSTCEEFMRSEEIGIHMG